MRPGLIVCQKSSLYLNEHAKLLTDPPAAFYIHYWGAKPHHRGNTPHAHDFFEICYVAEGSGAYIHDGVTYPLQRGTLYCSKPHSLHHIESEGDMLLLFVAFELVAPSSEAEPLAIFERLNRRQHLFIAEAEQSAAVLAWQALLHYCAADTVPYPQVAGRLAHCLLLTALTMFDSHGGRVTTGKPDETAYAGSLKAAKDYVTERLSAKLTLKETADAVHLSERQLSRLLSEQLGLSFPVWIRNERLKRAAYLLVYTDVAIAEIAVQTGFDSVHYFSKVFGETMRITPGKFRKAVQSNKSDSSLLHSYLHTAINRNLFA